MKFSTLLPGFFDSTKTICQIEHEIQPTDVANQHKTGTFRRVLPQILASSAKNLLILDFGLVVAFPTILIPALSGLNPELNANENLSISPDEATWLASVTFICQPLGSICSGFLTEPLGRKRAMILINLPFVFAWITLYYASTLQMIYVAFALLGVGVGLMEAPIFTYIGEICEPCVRGILTASAGIAAMLGLSLVFVLGHETSWRNSALLCAIIPLIAIFAICFVPETPMWLLSKNRQDEALKSLQWLRGWVTPSAVYDEFTDLQRCKIAAQICYACEKKQQICQHPPPTIRAKIRDFMRRRTLRPFLLISSQFTLSVFSGFLPFRPYIVQILHTYQTPVEPNAAVVWLGWISLSANIILLLTIRSFGKRSIYLWSMAAIIVISFALGIYGFVYLPRGLTSFVMIENGAAVRTDVPTNAIAYLPLVAFYLMQFVTSYGIGAIPNMMMCEVFPFKSRAFATGLAASTYYIPSFISAKTYYDLETFFSLPGVSIFYGLVGCVGFIAMYFMLPETEGRSLEDIEMYFTNTKRKLTDIHIPISANGSTKTNAAKSTDLA